MFNDLKSAIRPALVLTLLFAALLGIVVFWLFGQLSRVAVGRWHEVTGQS